MELYYINVSAKSIQKSSEKQNIQVFTCNWFGNLQFFRFCGYGWCLDTSFVIKKEIDFAVESVIQSIKTEYS